MKALKNASIDQSGSLDSKICLLWGEGPFKLDRESPLCRAIYMVAKQQEEEIVKLQNQLLEQKRAAGAAIAQVQALRDKQGHVATTRENLLEQLAALEHAQWIYWSKGVAEEVAPERAERWKKLSIPYADLPESEKDSDRMFAQKVLDLISKDLKPLDEV